MMSTVTQWFPAKQNPARKGVYERKHPITDMRIFAYWTGRHWLNWSKDAEVAASTGWLWENVESGSFYISEYKDLAWRGLVRDA
jgi:hypothetical protein